MAQESIVSASGGENSLLLAIKTRFTSTYSAIAWPKRLGLSFGLSDPPRLQAYGWNPGTRPEKNHNPASNICDIISLEDMQRYANIYFLEVHPFFGILDVEQFKNRAASFWCEGKRGTDFEACICGVVALGSYFANSKNSVELAAGSLPAEAQVLEHGKLLLDLSYAYPPSMISLKHVVAWDLRALYLRLTTRPHISWMASCTAVHLTEAIGLHREITEVKLPRPISALEIDQRRRIFWVTMAINQFFAAEYGRSRVIIDSIGCYPISEILQPGDLTTQTVAIMQSVPGYVAPGKITDSDVFDALAKATTLPTASPFLALLKADACFSIYRMLCLARFRIPPGLIPPFLEVIRVAMDADKFLRNTNEPWWNVVSTPFHAVCVLLTIETSECFEMLSPTLATLRNITEHYDSNLSREALRTALILVQAARDKKGKELENLDRGLGIASKVGMTQGSELSPTIGELQWHDDVDFLDFLDMTEYYGMDS
jgi:hypothetical protein